MKVNEIFYSLQGEGFHTGTPAVFIRLSGCNLACPFCDTDHAEGKEMSESEIVAAISGYPAPLVVITGGEPSLFLTETLVESLHKDGRTVAVETNGTRPLPNGVDWVTLSPKDAFVNSKNARPVLQSCNELKLVFDGNVCPERYDHIRADHRFLQPCDTGDEATNARLLAATVRYLLAHPAWRLSLQTHKIIGVR